MKRLILQVNVELDDHTGFARFKPVKEIYRLSEQQARQAAENWHADYLQITDCAYLPDKHPVFQRFKMYEMTEYDEILYLDMDAVVLPHCPNIFTRLQGNTFSAVRDSPWDEIRKRTGKSYDDERAKINQVLGASPDYRPFCSGVMLITREFLDRTRNEWPQYLDQFDRAAHDQSIFNKLVVSCYNGQYNELNEDWGPWYRSGKYIEHIGGPFKKFFNLERFIEKHKFGHTSTYNTLFQELS